MLDSLDYPILTAITYFTGILNTFMSFVTKSGLLFGLLGLGWSSFKLINSRMTIKELWWDTIYKWVLFILLCSFWKPFTTGVAKFANDVGSTSASKYISIESQLKDFRVKIKELVVTETIVEKDELLGKINRDCKTNLSQWDPNVLTEDEYDQQLIQAIQESKLSQDKKNKYIQELKEDKEKIANSSAMKTIKTLNDLLGDKDGISSYVANSIYMKNDGGYGFLSSASIFRFGLLISEVIWLRNQLNIETEYASIEPEDYDHWYSSISIPVQKLGIWITHIPQDVMCLLLSLGIILAVTFTILQYMMTCLEFIIISAVGVFFIPMILFDGTKELPKKFVPVFISLFTKLLVITLCMFYVLWSYLNLMQIIMESSGGMNWYNFGCILLQVVIGFILTSNAPKIAQTITTGQAQLSMGEFVAAAGVGLGAAKIANKGINAAKQKAGNIKNKVDNRIAASGARKMAVKEASENGGTKKEIRHAGTMAKHATLNSNGLNAKKLKTLETSKSASQYVLKNNTNNLNNNNTKQQIDKNIQNNQSSGYNQNDADKLLKEYDINKSPDA